MELFKKKRSSADFDETFVRLIQVAIEDEEIQKRLTTILSLEKEKKNFLLNKWLQELKSLKAPEDFILAISCFLDDSTAEKAIKIFNNYKTKKG
jgi:hypothetical protein